jgi:hypothetical protein
VVVGTAAESVGICPGCCAKGHLSPKSQFAGHRLSRGHKIRPGVDQPAPLAPPAERLTDEQCHTLFNMLTSADSNGDIATAWIAKELLRDVLACAPRGGLRYEISPAHDKSQVSWAERG